MTSSTASSGNERRRRRPRRQKKKEEEEDGQGEDGQGEEGGRVLRAVRLFFIAALLGALLAVGVPLAAAWGRELLQRYATPAQSQLQPRHPQPQPQQSVPQPQQQSQAQKPTQQQQQQQGEWSVEALRELERMRYALQPEGNHAWIEERHRKEEEEEDFNVRTNHAHEKISSWESHLAARTPEVFSEFEERGESMWTGNVTYDDSTPVPTSSEIDCASVDVVVAKRELWDPFGEPVWNEALRERITGLIIECGMVVLEDFYEKEKVQTIMHAYDAFRNTTEANEFFRYPCQGVDRIEYMMPFRPPWNSSDSIASDARLIDIVRGTLQDPIKLELYTVINSLPGSKSQRWHQGWRFLFHPLERTPPYALVVAVPLKDVSVEAGPTKFCPRRKLRFYAGYNCEDEAVSVATSEGSVIIFDYKALHVGPANESPSERPMVSMVFTKGWFLNLEAFANRAISLIARIHQTAWWESFLWHPRDSQLFWQV